MKVPFNLYLNRAKRIKLIPNFFISVPYLKLSNVKGFMEDGWVWIEDEEWLLFPPLSLTTNNHHCPFISKLKNVWSDFESLHPSPNFSKKEFLDWEYIFNPTHFNDLSGGKWETYRKNIRKWPRTHENWKYLDYIDTISNRTKIRYLLADWMEIKMENLQDYDLIINYILGYHSNVHFKFLYHIKDKLNPIYDLYAINVWDENWMYINYRYCIIKKDNPYLDEFARYLFYTDPIIQRKGKLINDGGCLGNEGLERFKDKLNPVKKRAVYSWIKF